MTGSRRRFLKTAAMAGAMSPLSSLFTIGAGRRELVSRGSRRAPGSGESVVLALVGDLFLTTEISPRRGRESERVG